MCNLGRFGWKAFGPNSVPFITRVINGEHVPYVAVRMIENHILSYDLKYLCDLVKNLTVTATEEKLLNEINTTHSNNVYGPRPFQAGVDRIVSMEDAKKYFPMYFSSTEIEK